MICFRNIRRQLFNATILKADLTPTAIDARKPKSDVQIVIIGAGLAGLSAANHLIKNGFHRTIILEANERYGGRVSSRPFGDSYCELGAKWIPIDASRDSTYELLQHASGLPKKIRQRHEIAYVNTLGEKINKQIPELIEMLYKKLCSGISLEQKYKTGDLHDLNSVHTYFQAEMTKIVKTLFKDDEQAVATDIFNTLFKEFASLLGCCLEYVNIEHITKVPTHDMNPIYIPTGLDNILNHIVNDIDMNHMKVGRPVGEIRWYSGAKRESKTVGCIDGSLFSADHIICTLPLGVLKNFSGYMFKPMLPQDKLRAIENIGFGSPVRIYFEYDRDVKRWFGANLRPIWNADERTRYGLVWTKQVVEIAKLPTSSRILEILIGGGFYDEIEKLPDVEVLQDITTLMRKFLRNPKIPYPTSLLRSNWNSSACFLGGRPYFSTDSSMNDVAALAAPLGESVPTLLFAGDATILHGFGTVDGARKSGIREAQRIIEYYKNRSD